MATRVSLVTLGDEAAESLVAWAEQTKMGYFEFLDAVLEEEVETPGGTMGTAEDQSWPSRGSIAAHKSVSAA